MARLGFRTAGFAKWPIADALAELARIGYDGVEVCLEHPDCRPEELTPARCAELLGTIRDAGLEVASVSYHADFEPPAERFENTLRAVEMVRHLGTDIFIINGRRAEPEGIPGVQAELWGLLADLLPRAERAGVRVAVEPEPGTAVASSLDMLNLMARMGSEALGVNLDVGHAYLTDDNVCESIRDLTRSILHTHFEGMPAGEHDHLIPGEGDIDLPAIGAALTEVGYKGYYTVDLFNIADDPVDWAERAFGGMRRIPGV